MDQISNSTKQKSQISPSITKTSSTQPPEATSSSDATSTSANVASPQSTSSSAALSQEQTISYSAERIIGNGSFGVVFQAAVVETGEIVAIKKVLQDKRFKNRELQIMRQLVKDPHSNIVALKHCFYSQVCSSIVLNTSTLIFI